jgi:hypothetical protein
LHLIQYSKLTLLGNKNGDTARLGVADGASVIPRVRVPGVRDRERARRPRLLPVVGRLDSLGIGADNYPVALLVIQRLVSSVPEDKDRRLGRLSNRVEKRRGGVRMRRQK